MAYEFENIIVGATISGPGVTSRAPVRVATTANGTLTTSFTAGSVIDGITLVLSDRLLIKNQDTPSENGVYIVTNGTPLRSPDCYTGVNIGGTSYYVKEGTANQATTWTCVSTGASEVVGTGGLVFTLNGQVTYAGAETISSKTITNSSINSTNIGAVSAGTGKFTTCEATTSLTTPFANITSTTNQLILGTSNTLTINSTQTGVGTLQFPDLVNATDTLTTLNLAQTLTNKIMTSNTNNILARGLWVASGASSVSVYAATAPSTGQVLTATSATTATWQDATGGISTLNTLTAATQTFAVGTTGTDFNISSSTSTHTFNIPSASATNRGLITTGAQTLAGTKTFANSVEITTTTGQLVLGTTNTTTVSFPAPASSITLTFPNTADTMVGRTTTDTMTNKTMTSNTNNVIAREIWIASGASSVSVYASNAPTVGQVLTATSASTATWQDTQALPGSGIVSLNSLVTTSQTFAVGTAGTNFNISSNASTHTFNIPDASASNRGLVTTGAQTFAGTKTLTEPIITAAAPPDPSAPGSGVKLFGKALTGRSMLSQVGPSGFPYIFQPAIFCQKIALMTPNTNATTVTALGAVWTATGGTARPLSNASFVASVSRIGYVTGNPSGSSAGVRSAVGQFWRGDAANRGGFFFCCRFFIASTQSSQRSFVGLYGTTSAIANVDPSSLVNILGFANDTAQSTLQFMYNDGAGTATAIALTGFAAQTTASTDFYDARIYCKPNDTVVYYSIQAIPSGTYLEGNVNTNIPAASQFLAPHVWTNNGASTGTLGIDVISLYIETDN